jgi:hypothetical protein
MSSTSLPRVYLPKQAVHILRILTMFTLAISASIHPSFSLSLFLLPPFPPPPPRHSTEHARPAARRARAYGAHAPRSARVARTPGGRRGGCAGAAQGVRGAEARAAAPTHDARQGLGAVRREAGRHMQGSKGKRQTDKLKTCSATHARICVCACDCVCETASSVSPLTAENQFDKKNHCVNWGTVCSRVQQAKTSSNVISTTTKMHR